MDTSNNKMKDHHRDHHSPNNNKVMIKNQTTNINPNNPKDYSWNFIYNNHHHQTTRHDQDQEDFMINAFSWPPRSYTCSFCKREFRSAQALGGHMNVHRKDRARLRQSPPPPRDIIHGRYGNTTTTAPTFLNLNLNHNPNPSFPCSNLNITTASPLCSLTSKPPLSSLLPSPYSALDNNDIETRKWPWTSNHIELDHDGQYPLIDNVKGPDKTTSFCGVGEEQHEGFSGRDHAYNCKSLKKKMAETMTATSVRLDLEIGLFRAHESEIGRDLDLELRLGYSN